jgi:EAL domain-containing protein (putative c-di-GMP-specific phosphodiesterase class I)
MLIGVETSGVFGVDRHHDALYAPTSRFAREAVGDMLAQGGVDIGFQPVVELSSRRVVGYEALARGPQGSVLEPADALFAAARGAGRLEEVDLMCQTAALRGALAAGLRAPAILFLNIEPEASGFMPLELRALYAQATAQFMVAVEVTERALTERPAALLGHVADMRALGCAIALDDVGAEVDSLAMMGLLAPEVIKLDLALAEAAADEHIAELVTAVGAQAERSGATILVERIETPRQAELVDALGAQLAQGWLFGRRARLVPGDPPSGSIVSAGPRSDPRDTTPFAIASEARRTGRAGRRLLEGMSHHLEEQAARAGTAAVLLSSFETDRHFDAETRDRYARLARQVGFCGVVAEGIGADPAPGVRGGALHPADPLAHEWTTAVVSPQLAVALCAYDQGDGTFEFVLTHDRELAASAAASLMARIAA